MKIKYKHTFDHFLFKNRWSEPRYSRNGDWTIIGVSEWWCSPMEYAYKFCLFGLELHIWMKREVITNK